MAMGHPQTPLTRAEFIFIKGRGEIDNCREISPLNQHLDLRTKWEDLAAAGDMAKAILETQMPHKPAMTLYELFHCYLSKIPSCINPKALSASFRLKILRHDGLLHLTPHCSICGITIGDQHLFEGQSFCNDHAPNFASIFSSHEMETILILTYCRSLSILAMMPLSPELEAKIVNLFRNAMV